MCFKIIGLQGFVSGLKFKLLLDVRIIFVVIVLKFWRGGCPRLRRRHWDLFRELVDVGIPVLPDFIFAKSRIWNSFSEKSGIFSSKA